ncbi:MAG TPA: CBS domain-containing protein [Actinomycetota bacterium]|nr:CBS domain-containing protein [Actinomycetota bacterium]
MKLLRDIAIRHLLTIDPTSSLRRAAKVMSDRGVGCAVAIENEKVAGIITERDILHAVAHEQNVDETTVADVMTRDVVSGSPGWDLVKAVKTMTEGGFRHLLVMEMDDPVGIVSLRDLMDSMASMAELVQEPSEA